MPNIRQKAIKPGIDLNYSDACKVKATEAISANDIVVVTGSSGAYPTVIKADITISSECRGRMLIAKHDIPANGFGVCVPWRTITGTVSGGTLGAQLYLNTSGAYVARANISASAVACIPVGRVLDATGSGKILLATSMSSSGQASITGADLGNVVSGGAPSAIIHFDVATAGATSAAKVIPYGFTIANWWMIKKTEAADGSDTVKLQHDNASFETWVDCSPAVSLGTSAKGVVVQGTFLDAADQLRVVAYDATNTRSFKVVSSGDKCACDVYIELIKVS